MPDQGVTIRSVAKLAGVSTTTVSLVMNNSETPQFSAETRQRVLEAARELDYRPSASAQHMRTQKSGLIGFVSDVVATTPYAVDMIRGAQEAAWQQGKVLLVLNTENKPNIEQRAIEILVERRVEGLIYAAMYHQAVTPPMVIHKVPTVLLDCYCEDRSLPSVVPDEFVAAKTATQILLQKGHRRIGFMNHVAPQPATVDRPQGYRQALDTFGVSFDENLVRSAWCDSRGGYQCAMELMKLLHPPTALFCFNDQMAMGAYDALRKLNLRIPEDVAVIGIDNLELIAAYLYPPLSTMALPHYEMGVWAMDYLLQMISDPDTTNPALQHKMECKFIERASL
jgi:LacI family transcriptional regulator